MLHQQLTSLFISIQSIRIDLASNALLPTHVGEVVDRYGQLGRCRVNKKQNNTTTYSSAPLTWNSQLQSIEESPFEIQGLSYSTLEDQFLAFSLCLLSCSSIHLEIKISFNIRRKKAGTAAPFPNAAEPHLADVDEDAQDFQVNSSMRNCNREARTEKEELGNLSQFVASSGCKPIVGLEIPPGSFKRRTIVYGPK
jgi:hypothetical protein